MSEAGTSLYPRTRAIRQLIRLSRDPEHRAKSGRALLMKWGSEKGCCTWCGEPVEKKSGQWCSEECVQVFLIARALNRWPMQGHAITILPSEYRRRFNAAVKWRRQMDETCDTDKNVWLGAHRNSPLWISCAMCGEKQGSIIDHILPVSVAWELQARGVRGWWKAWTPQNLQHLCHDCHVTKTTKDKRRLALLRRGHPDNPDLPDHPEQFEFTYEDSTDGTKAA